jgi:hypothetical protein
MITSRRPLVVAALAALLGSGLAVEASARPNYFEVFTGIYALSPSDPIYACGACHRRWEGTGARNPYGDAIEQQLYIGKTITNAILDIEGADTDGDGFTNGDELSTWLTLPGYSCATFDLVINPPPDFQSLITPGVPSCLEPMDVEVTPTIHAFVTEVGEVDTMAIEVRNNGTDFAITVSDYVLLAGSSPRLSVDGPALPIVIPVGQVSLLDLSFYSPVSEFVSGTLRITSDDPDEAVIDVAVTGLSFVKNLAPAAARAACFGEVQKRMAKYGKTHLKEWGRCYLDELGGIACDTGRRDLKIAKAADKLRSAVGGASDKRCAGAGLTPALLDLPDSCGAPCEPIELHSISDWADCLVCRQDAGTDAMLDAVVGTSPPDLPPDVLGPDSLRCSGKLAKGIRKGIDEVQRLLGSCELANVTAASPVDCAATLASEIAAAEAQVDSAIDSCRSTADLSGCLFEPGADPGCLGDAATSIGTDLVDSVFATAD